MSSKGKSWKWGVNRGRICSVAHCTKPAKTRGWCYQHYKHWKKHGDVELGYKLPPVVDGQRTCQRCGRAKPADEFVVRRSRPGGQGYCADCYRLENKVGNVRRRYGLTVDEYEARLAKAECAICGRSDVELHLDHCHITKQVRDPLCRNCNQGLGKFGDSPLRLRVAADYIIRHWNAHQESGDWTAEINESDKR